MKTFQMFSEYSGLRLNTTKCEIAGLGGLKGVKTALCGMVCIDLTKETIKILASIILILNTFKLKKNSMTMLKPLKRC